MGELTRDKHSTSYSVKIDNKEDFLSICDYDNIVSTQKTLFERLGDIAGMNGVDYNGHFGARIWFTLDVNYDSNGTWIDIFQTINNFIKEAKEKN